MQRGKVIAYEARSPSPAERDYTTGEQEFLAVVHALEAWRRYLGGGEKAVGILTHHAAKHLPALSGNTVAASDQLVRISAAFPSVDLAVYTWKR